MSSLKETQQELKHWKNIHNSDGDAIQFLEKQNGQMREKIGVLETQNIELKDQAQQAKTAQIQAITQMNITLQENGAEIARLRKVIQGLGGDPDGY